MDFSWMATRLLSASWLRYMGSGGRKTVSFDVPADGREGDVPDPVESTPIGKAVVRRRGTDLTVVSVAVGVHRALEASKRLERQGISCEVIDLRSTRPLDAATMLESVSRTGQLLVVDEDYRNFGLSGELAALALEAGVTPRYARVCLDDTLPYARHLEDRALPNVERIVAAATSITG